MIEIKDINTLNTQTFPVTRSTTFGQIVNNKDPLFLAFLEIEAIHEETMAEILEIGKISDLEKTLVQKLEELTETPDPLDPEPTSDLLSDSIATNKLVGSRNSGQILSITNQLIDSCNSEYSYYYHFFNGTFKFLNMESIDMQPELNEALEELNKSIQLDPNFGEAYFVRGLIHGYMGNDKMRNADLATALEVGSDSAVAYFAEQLKN